MIFGISLWLMFKLAVLIILCGVIFIGALTVIGAVAFVISIFVKSIHRVFKEKL